MVFKCPAKLYTLKIITHNRIREHPKGCSFSLVHITICIVTQITYIFESGEFTELVRHGCGQKLFIVTRVTVTSTRVILLSLPSPTLWKSFACVVFRVTVTVTGDGRGDGNSCAVSRFVTALLCSGKLPEPQVENAAPGIVMRINAAIEYNFESTRKGALFSSKRRARSLWSTRTEIKMKALCFSTTHSTDCCVKLQNKIHFHFWVSKTPCS